MARSKILTGIFTQRDRAQLRGRLDRKKIAAKVTEILRPLRKLISSIKKLVRSDKIPIMEAIDLD